MDRLLSGDVGFGKTEVAMNNVSCDFRWFSNDFVCPTTLLATQHYHSMQKDFRSLE